MITQEDLILLGIFDLLILFMVIFLNKELKYYSFNQRLSKIFGVPANIINLVFLTITSVTIVVSVKIIGIILITALLITPGVIAKLYAKSINQMLIISVIVGVFSSVLGIFLSYYLNVPSGPMIVLTMFLIFLIAYLLRKTVLKSFAQ
jgi:zinc transport system permease protein